MIAVFKVMMRVDKINTKGLGWEGTRETWGNGRWSAWSVSIILFFTQMARMMERPDREITQFKTWKESKTTYWLTHRDKKVAHFPYTVPQLGKWSWLKTLCCNNLFQHFYFLDMFQLCLVILWLTFTLRGRHPPFCFPFSNVIDLHL